MPHPPMVYLDRPLESLEEGLNKLTFLSEILTRPVPDGENLPLTDAAMCGLANIFDEITAQIRASSETLAVHLRERRCGP